MAASLTTRTSKGSALSWAEMDANLNALNAEIIGIDTKFQEYVSVKDYGAEGDGTTDDTAAIQAAIDANAGRIIFFPHGTYKVTSGLTVTDDNTTLLGEGDYNQGAVIDAYHLTADTITFTGCQHSGIENIHLRGRNISTAGYALKFAGGGFKCFARKVRIDYTYNGIFIENCTETRLYEITLRYLLGTQGILYTGTVGTGSYRAIIDDLIADNPYPLAVTTYKSWAPTTSFTAGDVIYQDSRIYQCTTSGTSGATGPTGTPGTTSFNVFSTEITDGSAKWKFVSRDLSWVVQDNYAYSLVIDKAALINGSYGFYMRDTAATGSSYPIWAFCQEMECDHTLKQNVLLDRGEGFVGTSCWFGSCLSGNGVLIQSTFRGEVNITATRISYAAQHGVLLQSGSVDLVLDGNMIGDNSQSSSTTYHGVSIAANASRFSITNNRIGDIVGVSGNPQGYGVLISSGTSDNFIVANNNLNGNTSGAISDASTGTTKFVANNVGATTRSTVGVDSSDDLIVNTATKGLVLKDTQGTPHYWRVTVSNAGALVITDLGTTKP